MIALWKSGGLSMVFQYGGRSENGGRRVDPVDPDTYHLNREDDDKPSNLGIHYFQTNL